MFINFVGRVDRPGDPLLRAAEQVKRDLVRLVGVEQLVTPWWAWSAWLFGA
jgi:hypothetical protein